jgi:hypothetical protein
MWVWGKPRTWVCSHKSVDYECQWTHIFFAQWVHGFAGGAKPRMYIVTLYEWVLWSMVVAHSLTAGQILCTKWQNLTSCPWTSISSADHTQNHLPSSRASVSWWRPGSCGRTPPSISTHPYSFPVVSHNVRMELRHRWFSSELKELSWCMLLFDYSFLFYLFSCKKVLIFIVFIDLLLYVSKLIFYQLLLLWCLGSLRVGAHTLPYINTCHSTPRECRIGFNEVLPETIQCIKVVTYIEHSLHD